MTMIRRLLASVVVATFGAVVVAPAAAQEIQERTIRFGHLNNADHPVSFGVKRFARAGRREERRQDEGPGISRRRRWATSCSSSRRCRAASRRCRRRRRRRWPASSRNSASSTSRSASPTSRQADALLDGPLGKALIAKLPEKGLVALGYWDLGFRNVTNSKRPITKAEDLDGLKIRVIPNPVFLETFKAFKANPVPMPFAELYGALESKAVDGQENPFSVILSNKFYEVQKYVSATNHVYAANIVLVSKNFWDKLSPTEKKIMNDAADEARTYQRQVSRAAAQKAVGELQAKGMAYNEVSAAELARMRTIAKPVTEKFIASYDPAIVKLYRDETARIQK